MMYVLGQISEAGQLLAQAEKQGFVVYLLVFLIISLAAVIIFLFRRLETRTDNLITLYQDIARNDQQIKELSALIKDRNVEAMKELIAKMEVERRLRT
jgi:hypothetical protein